MVNKWDICFCRLDPTQGSEQRGVRPAMVQQIRTVAHSRLESPKGRLQDTDAREKILEAIRMYFEA